MCVVLKHIASADMFRAHMLAYCVMNQSLHLTCLGVRACVLYYESELTAHMFYESEHTANMFRAYVLV